MPKISLPVKFVSPTSFSVSNVDGKSLVQQFPAGVKILADCGLDGKPVGSISAASHNARTGETTVVLALPEGKAITERLVAVYRATDKPETLPVHGHSGPLDGGALAPEVLALFEDISGVKESIEALERSVVAKKDEAFEFADTARGKAAEAANAKEAASGLADLAHFSAVGASQSASQAIEAAANCGMLADQTIAASNESSAARDESVAAKNETVAKAAEVAANVATIPDHVATGATESVFGHVKLSSTIPAALGTPSKGSSNTAAKSDHVHPTTGLMTTDGTQAFTGAVSGITPTADTHLTTKAYVDSVLSVQDAMVYKGVLDCSTNPNFPAADRGHTYKVSVAGKVGGASGTNVEVGDMLICSTDGTVTGDLADVGVNWGVVQVNIDGAVTGPASSTSGNIPTFNGSGGKAIQDSGILASNIVRKDANSIIQDNVKTSWGAGSDLSIYHDGGNTYFDNITGSIYIRPAVSETGILIVPNGAVSLFYDNAVKLATSSTGVTVTGTMAATTVTGANVTSGSDPGHTHTAYVPKATGTTKGDIIGFSGVSTPVRVGVGSDGQVLTADSTNAAGFSWKQLPSGADNAYIKKQAIIFG